ncbi:hypothetical protein FRC11_004079 [Ceratobasidium sp. 423]|nr:hypothetical protein FRC11_004079 [Ceratobasidium sp. 423]
MIIRNEEELEPVRQAVHRLVHRALALDGTCTGEHGVGVGKKEYLVEELGPGTVELMRTVKRAIDPHNLFNPGKMTRHEVSTSRRIAQVDVAPRDEAVPTRTDVLDEERRVCPLLDIADGGRERFDPEEMLDMDDEGRSR